MTFQKEVHSGWNFDNSYARLPDIFFRNINPTPAKSPKIAVFNNQLASELGLNVEALKSDEGINELAGNKIPEGGFPIAQAYAGHQFGYFNMLGDGRAILLGEQITPNNDRFDIQFKGSGRTPYSRGGDGRAALGPMLREYIISEAMYALGIPTTRSLAVVTTGELIQREVPLPGAILTRIASSHIRVGTFQFASKFGSIEDLRSLADYTILRHYPSVRNTENHYLSLLQEVIKNQAELIAKWQLVGFIHGVMNTDNMTISGETIDYGPCAFMDTYNPNTVFSSIDTQGRYAYGNQPLIAGWNLARFAESLLPIIHEDQEEAVKLAQDEVSKFIEIFHAHWVEGMRAKLGLFNKEEKDEALIEELLNLMEKHEADYTNTFLSLTVNKFEEKGIFGTSDFKKWHELWQERKSRQNESEDESLELMKKSNPALIPRNHRVEEALEAAVEKEDFSVMERLLKALSNPYEHRVDQYEYCTVPSPSNGTYRTYCGT